MGVPFFAFLTWKALVEPTRQAFDSQLTHVIAPLNGAHSNKAKAVLEGLW
jgi:hypothetical protein